ncbi:MAG: HAMP domain-containing histidine kinase [Chitinophagaceae bacterium]|nr:HAMP domain-containing histidine kinase [Chitinophagaceae bacterium]
MNRLRWLALLMGITILGITGFQLYWLKQSYEREKRTLDIKTAMLFRESIMHLQMAKLKLDGFEWGDSARKGKVKMVMEKGTDRVSVRFAPKQEIVSTINVIRDKLTDSLRQTVTSSGMVIATGKDSLFEFNRQVVPGGKGGRDHVISLLYGVDSLQDSIRVGEIDTAYRMTLKAEKLDIPFSILRQENVMTEEPTAGAVTIGFSKPVTYKLNLGNTFPYLLKKISLPILFSVILLGITILSFVLLYRNLLRQRRLAALKNEFISNITHELKTPIATVGVAIEALKNFNAINDPQRTKEYLDISSNELQRLGLLVDKVLKLSMFEKKEIDLKFETINLKTVVDEVVASLRLQLEKYHARVTVTSQGDTIMKGDMLHLQSVVFNLLDNALKYGKKEPAIDVTVKQESENIVLCITDNGIGMAQEYKDKIFDKFFRIPHGDTHNAKGYGLGLSYVAQVIQKHNGTISVDSQPGIGTKFTITLPTNSNE